MKRLSTSLFATSKDLTKDFKIKPSSPLKSKVERLIRDYQEKCSQLQVELNHYTIEDIMDYLDGERQRQQTIALRKTFGRQVYNMNNENAELALVKLMELFNHSSVVITKCYLGLRQEELLNTYDCLSF